MRRELDDRFEWRLQRNMDAVHMPRRRVGVPQVQCLHILDVFVLSFHHAITGYDDLAAFRKHRRDEELCLLLPNYQSMLQWWLLYDRQLGRWRRVPRHRVRVGEAERAIVDVVLKVERDAGDLGRVRSYDRAEDAPTLVERRVRLCEGGGFGDWASARVAEPREVLATPIVADFVLIVLVVVPQAEIYVSKLLQLL